MFFTIHFGICGLELYGIGQHSRPIKHIGNDVEKSCGARYFIPRTSDVLCPPALPMNLFKWILPILASTLQLTYSGKYSVPGKASYARLCGPRMPDVILPSFPETNAEKANADDTHPPSE
jgi:hypothetical protein